MAENGLVTPPLFREALIQPGSWTLTESWQRWLSAFWQQAQTTAGNAPGPGPWQPLDATVTAFAALTGTPNTFAYFTATESMALTGLSAYSRTLLALGDAGSWRSTLGLGSGATITASGTAPQVAYWSGATTLTGTGALLVTGTGIQTGRLGVAYAPPSNVWLRSGHGDFDTMRLGSSSDTIARWALDCPGQGYIGTLGVYYGPDQAVTDGVDFRTYRARIDQLSVGVALSGYSLAAGNTWLTELRCDGPSHLHGNVGIGQWAPGTYKLQVTGTANFQNEVGFGTAPVGGYSITAQYLSKFNAGLQVLGTLTAYGGVNIVNMPAGDGAALYSNMSASGGGWRWFLYQDGTAPNYLGGTLQLASRAGFGYGPDGTHWIRAGVSQFDQTGFGNVYDSRFTVRSYGDMYIDGTPYKAAGGPWVTYSDMRLKRNVQPLRGALETLCQLDGITYEWAETGVDGKQLGVHMGLLAQDVERVLPQWVGELCGYKTVAAVGFEALAIEAIKTLTARVAALEGA